MSKKNMQIDIHSLSFEERAKKCNEEVGPIFVKYGVTVVPRIEQNVGYGDLWQVKEDSPLMEDVQL